MTLEIIKVQNRRQVKTRDGGFNEDLIIGAADDPR